MHAVRRMDTSELNGLTEAIIGAAIDVHRELGPGLLEQSYEACFCFELLSRGLNIERQKPLPINYKSQHLDCGYRIDVLVERAIVVEIKAIQQFERVHFAQLRSQLEILQLSRRIVAKFQRRASVEKRHHTGSEWPSRVVSSLRASRAPRLTLSPR